MTAPDIGAYAPGVLVVLGSVINFAANLLKVRDLERRVKTIEEKIHDDALRESIVQQLKAEGHS